MTAHALRVYQQAKNATYRGVGETSKLFSSPRLDGDRTLRVLTYHKVNDHWPNPITVPTRTFDRQMSLLSELGYRPVSLEAVRDHYVDGTPLPRRAVLITFDDGYRDNLENAAPILLRHGYPAVIFVPTRFLDDDTPLPHEAALRQRGVWNPTIRWSDFAALEASGLRIESHGVSHTRLSQLDPEEVMRELVVSKRGLEERLGREVEAFAYIKGTSLDFGPEHPILVQQAGYTLAFTGIFGANSPESDRFQLRRYSIEPFSARSFELVLAGACDVLALKDGETGTRMRRALMAAIGTPSR
jgi:peptidoglycan/xylan/chitin deacetylase (PgdA/CDA1 family)